MNVSLKITCDPLTSQTYYICNVWMSLDHSDLACSLGNWVFLQWPWSCAIWEESSEGSGKSCWLNIWLALYDLCKCFGGLFGSKTLSFHRNTFSSSVEGIFSLVVVVFCPWNKEMPFHKPKGQVLTSQDHCGQAIIVLKISLDKGCSSLTVCIYLYVCVLTHMCTLQVCGSQRTACGNWLSPSCTPNLEIECRFSGLVEKGPLRPKPSYCPKG